MKIKQIMLKILWILYILFLIFLIIAIIQKLAGGGLSYEALVIGLLIANLGYSWWINSQLQHHLGWHKGLENGKRRKRK